jgi:hypothetical protein
MGNSRVETVRAWAGRNEPFFRLIELVVVIFFGGVITTVVSCTQTTLTKKQLLVAEKELELNGLQSQFARAELSPRFDFTSRDAGPISTIEISCKEGRAADLRGRAKFYIEKTQSDGPTTRIEIDPFFSEAVGAADGQLIEFSVPRDLHDVATYAFYLPWEKIKREEVEQERALNRIYLNTEQFQNRRVCCYVELDYFNIAKEKVTDRFVMIYPSRRARPVDAEPNYDHVFKLFDYYKNDRPDYEAIVEKLRVLLRDPPIPYFSK